MKTIISISIISMLIWFSYSCKARATTIKNKPIKLESFYSILDSMCKRVNSNDTNLIYSSKYYSRQYILLFNTINNYRDFLVRSPNDTNLLNCINYSLKNGVSVYKIAQKYNAGRLIGRKNYIAELNIYVPDNGEENSYYKIIELQR